MRYSELIQKRKTPGHTEMIVEILSVRSDIFPVLPYNGK